MDINKLRRIADVSNSMRAVMRGMEYSESGQTLKMIKRVMEENKIELGFPAGSHSTKKKDLSEILVENSSYSSRTLKERLIKEDLLQNRCYADGCPNPEPIWNNQELVLQLEHKNGTHSDNRIENLELLCPNCHTQTVTWGGKTRNAPLE